MSSKDSKQTHPQKKQKTEPAEENDTSLKELKEFQKVQEKLDKLEEELHHELIQVENRYVDKRKPIYKERNDVIKTIPDFWKKTLLNHPVLSEVLSEDDATIINYLDDLMLDEFDAQSFRITLKFKSNPYFTDGTLWKEFRFTEDGEGVTVTTSGVNWKSGKNPGEDHFFGFWFDKKTAQDQTSAGTSDEVGEIFKSDVFPNPTALYLGLASELGDEEGSEDEEGEEEEDEEEDQ